MNIHLRLEMETDYKETENVTREAFWDIYRPGCSEHLVLHKIRNSASFIKELDYVAVCDNQIAGNIIYSKAKIINDNNTEYEVLCMGPLCVLPSYQKKGIGSALNTISIPKAREMGFKGIILFGSPEYYKQFGYRNASSCGIKTADGKNFEAFMALELYENSLQGIEGRFQADSAFVTADDELELFDKQFPYKEKHVTATQFK